MKTQAAVLWEPGQPWQIEELELYSPKHGEVLLQLAASGTCHSDEHVRDGDLPMCRLERLAVHRWPRGRRSRHQGRRRCDQREKGDHVALGFIPACGRCPRARPATSNLCDLGAISCSTGRQISDGTTGIHVRGKGAAPVPDRDVRPYTMVHEAPCIKIPNDIPARQGGAGRLRRHDRLGARRCTPAASRPGETVVVVGCGGVGCGAIQGARLAGAAALVAVDPVVFKRGAGQDLRGDPQPREHRTRRSSRSARSDVGPARRQGLIIVAHRERQHIEPADRLSAKGGTYGPRDRHRGRSHRMDVS